MSNLNSSKRMPTPEEIQRELQEFLKDKYGEGNVMTQVDSLGSKESSGELKDEETKLDFTLTPEELEKYLKKYVVRQEEAVEILSTKIVTHFRRMQWEATEGKDRERIPGQIKPNILMIGPTGVGKTYIIKLIADYLGVPFVKGDATKFSETGYVGGDVEDLVRDLVSVAKGDISKAEHGIIYIDEIDKIAASSGSHGHGPDVSRTGVQRNLLKLMEETDVELRVPHDLASQMEAVMETQKSGKAPRKKVNTRNILFIVSGAFSGLDKIVKRRMNRQPIGFGGDVQTLSEKSDDELLDFVSTQDLIEFGFESEFIGRLPVIARLRNLDVEGLYEILTNKFNAVVQGKIRDFAAYNIDLNFSEGSLRKIAELAHTEKTGARGLTRVMERAVIPFEKRLPSTTIRKLSYTEDMIDNPQDSCTDLVTGGTLQLAVDELKDKTGVDLVVSPAAKRWLQEHVEDGKTPGDLLTSKLDSMQYAFNLLKKDSLQVTVKLLENPKEYMEDLIKQTYSGEEKQLPGSTEE